MELFFEGLCAFVEINGEWEVWMGEGGTIHTKHLPTLTVPSLALKPHKHLISDGHEPLPPDGIGFLPLLNHNLFSRTWLLRGHTLEVVTDDTGTTKWRGNDRKRVLDLTTIHSNLKPKKTGSTAVIKLKGGVLSVHRTNNFKINRPRSQSESRPCADVIKWTGSGLLQDETGRRIEFGQSPAAVGTVCNSAPDQGGAAHFPAFYEFIEDVRKEERISVEPAPLTIDNASEGENCSPNTII